MHLTRNHTTVDPSLKSYYQFNEIGQGIYDRAGTVNGILNGSAAHVLSTAPVGSGNSDRMTITSFGLKNFPNEGLSMTFPVGTLPNGEICVTRLNLQPDSVPTNRTFANTAKKYWIINNYGTTNAFASVSSMTMTGYGSVSTNQALSPRKFKLFNRPTGGFLASAWTKIDSAYAVSSGTNGVVSYSGSAVSYFNTQFTITRDSCIQSAAPGLLANTATVCANGNLTLTANGSLNDASGWKWYRGACGSTLQATGNSVVVSPSVTTTYYVRGEGGCAATGSCSAITISVIGIPAAPTALLGSTLACQGGSATFSVSPVAGASSYNWTLPNGWTGSSGSNTLQVSINGAPGTLSVTAVNSCGASQMATLAVALNASVSASQTLNLCYGQKINIGNSTYSTSGTYSNVLTRYNGCDSLLITDITVDSPIDITLSDNGFNVSSNAVGATYQWIDCDNNNSVVPGQTAQVFTAPKNGNYAVIVSIDNCSDTSDCVTIANVGIGKNVLENQVKIYPNPTTQKLVIETSLTSGTIILTTALGKEVHVRNIVKGQKQVLDLGHLANGIYFIKIESEGKSLTQKIVKE